MHRRTFLTTTGASLATALAGCSDSSDPDASSETSTATPTATATKTDTPTNTETELTAAEALGLSRTELGGVFQSLQSAGFYSAERRSITVDYQEIATPDHQLITSTLEDIRTNIQTAADQLDSDDPAHKNVAALRSGVAVAAAGNALIPEMATTYRSTMDSNYYRQAGQYQQAIDALEPAYDTVERWETPTAQLDAAFDQMVETKAPAVDELESVQWGTLRLHTTEFATAEGAESLALGLYHHTQGLRSLEDALRQYRNEQYDRAYETCRASHSTLEKARSEAENRPGEFAVGAGLLTPLLCVSKARKRGAASLRDAALSQQNDQTDQAKELYESAMYYMENLTAEDDCYGFPDGRSLEQ
jgi:tetratricopeptide (TPR) repeat protein